MAPLSPSAVVEIKKDNNVRRKAHSCGCYVASFDLFCLSACLSFRVSNSSVFLFVF